MPGRETRERILDVTERLFAEQGISGTSLRALTRAAGVNLAAIHYHFGSKEALLDAVVARRAAPLNRERLAELDRLEAQDAPASVEEILAALFTAGTLEILAVPETSQRLSRLMARIDAQPPEVVEPLYRKHFGEVGRRFVEALQRALPALPKEVVSDRYRCGVGVLSYLFSGNFDLDVVPGHPSQTPTNEERIQLAISFVAAGLRAPVVPSRAPARSTR